MIGLASLFAMSAFASPLRLQVSNGTSNYTVFDGLGGDLNTSSSALTIIKKVGNWELNTVTGSSLSPVGSLNLVSVNANTSGASNPGPLTIWFTELNISVPYLTWSMSVGGTNVKTNVRYSAYYDNSNQYPTDASGNPTGTPTLIGCLPSCSTSYTGAFSGDLPLLSASPGTSGVLYSLTQKLEINAIDSFPGNTFSTNANLTPIPEPATLLLLGTGLTGLGLIRRKRAGKS